MERGNKAGLIIRLDLQGTTKKRPLLSEWSFAAKA